MQTDREQFELTVGRQADLIAPVPCPICLSRDAPKPHKTYPGFDRCWSHMTRSQRAVSKRPPTAAPIAARRYNIYTSQLSEAMTTIQESIEQHDQTHKLYDTGVFEELRLMRILVMTWLENHKEDPDIPLKDLLECVSLVTKVAKLAIEIQKADQNEISADMRRTIVTLVSNAFHRANLAADPAERALIFTTELSRSFSGKPAATIENVSAPIDAAAVALI